MSNAISKIWETRLCRRRCDKLNIGYVTCDILYATHEMLIAHNMQDDMPEIGIARFDLWTNDSPDLWTHVLEM